jgi:hypothetical protein
VSGITRQDSALFFWKTCPKPVRPNFLYPIDVAALLRRAITARPEQQRRLLNAHVAKALDP